MYPHGHIAFNDLMLESMKMHSDKNRHYAGGGEALGNFTRMANVMSNYPNFPIDSAAGMAVMYAMKHLDAVLWSMAQGKKPPEDSLIDLGVYFTLIRCMNR